MNGAVAESTWPVKRMRFLVRRDVSEERRRLLDGVTRATFLPIEAVGDRGDLDLSTTRYVDDVRNGYTQFVDGDVLVARITPCFENGKGGLVRATLNGIGFGTTELHVLTPTSEIDGRYLYYTTVSDRFRKLGEAAMFGAAGQKRVPEEFVANYRVPVPPIERQRAIADYLDRETARLDALVAAKQRLLVLLAEKRRALIARAVTRGLDPRASLRDSGVPWMGGIPAHWNVWKIGHLASVGNGSTPRRDKAVYWADGTIPWLNSSVVNQAEVTRAEQFVTSRAARECHLPTVTSGAVLIAITGQGKTRGQAVVLSIKATINQHLAFVQPDPSKMRPWFLRWALFAAYPFLRSISDGAGGTKGALTCEDVGNLRVPVPSPSEQAAILDHIAALTGRIDSLRAATERTFSVIKERRAALITAAVTGRLDVGSAS